MTRFLIAALLITASPALAAAQLDEGQRLLADADFEGAIAALNRAERQDGLSREDVITLFETRAIARRANGDEVGARIDLEALAALDPGHVFPAEAPPDLADQMRAIGAPPLAIVTDWEDDAQGVTLHASVTGDSLGLVHDLVIWTRVGGAAWRRVQGSSATVPGRGEVRGYVEGVGPGGAVIVVAGTREAPLSHAVSTSPEAPPTASDDTLLHIGIAVGAGGLALVIAIVVAVVVTSQPSNQTRLEGPVIVGF